MLTPDLRRALFLALLLSPLAACGGDESGAAPGPPAAPPPPARSFERVDSPAARELRSALDFGDLPRARELLPALLASLPVEGDLLRARVEALAGRDVEVARRIEAARARSPEDPRVWATAAELHAAAGRLETAREELRRGVDRCGLTPELMRAQAVIQLCQQGGAERGLELLQRALAYDPELPFVARASGQAHLLIGKRALGERRPRKALESARRAVERDPGDLDASLFLADALAANADFEGAVEVLARIVAAGHGRESELALMHKRAAMASLLEHDRESALEHFREARTGGLTDEELGSGAQMLADEAMADLERGIAAFEAGDLQGARECFERGLENDGEILVLHNHLAVVLFQQEEFLPAATEWRWVLDTTIEEGIEPPDPVHIFLAKAFHGAGEMGEARAVLEGYLEREPGGKWEEQTRELLAELP